MADGAAEVGEAEEAGAEGPAGVEGAEAAEVVVALPAALGYVAAGELHARLRDLVACPSVVFDARGVERVSTAAVLVVASFLAARRELTPPAAVDGASGAFVDAFSALGLFPELMRMEFRG